MRTRTIWSFLAAMMIALPIAAEHSLAAGKPDPVKATAEAIMSEIVQGIVQGDYNRYARHFDARLKNSLTREAFYSVQGTLQKAVGQFQYMEYLGYLSWSGQTLVLFKSRFSKTKDDVLIRLVLNFKDKPTVVGLSFDAPALR